MKKEFQIIILLAMLAGIFLGVVTAKFINDLSNFLGYPIVINVLYYTSLVGSILLSFFSGSKVKQFRKKLKD